MYFIDTRQHCTDLIIQVAGKDISKFDQAQRLTEGERQYDEIDQIYQSVFDCIIYLGFTQAPPHRGILGSSRQQ